MRKNILAKLSPFHFLMLLIAGIINAIGVTLFIAPVQLYDSGISGTSILLSQLTPDYLSLSFFLILLNIPLLLFGFKRQGATFSIYAIFTVCVYSVAAWLITDVLPIDVSIASPLAGTDLFLCALFGGIISGVGSGLAIRYGGAMDGIEVVAVIFAKPLGLSVGTFVLIYNVLLYIICGIVMGSWILPLYSIVTYAAGSKTVDFIVDGLDSAKAAMIITTHPDEIARAKDAGVVALKLYPAGATTNSDAGVTDIRKTYKTLEAMQKAGLLLLVHGEVTSPDIDLFDREAVFIDQQLIPLRRDFPELKIVFEHITTREAAQYVMGSDAHTAATITAHHLLYNRNAIFTGGIRPHYYCLPVLKRETHRLALVQAATSGSSKFFLGTDSAPHPAHLKEHASGCAGCYTAHAAMELYAEAFDQAGALDKLEAFASFNGPAFYGLPRNQGSITLRRESWTPPESFAFGEAELKPLRAGETLAWKLVA